MDFSNVERALIYHTTMRFDHPAVGNELVLTATKNPRLLASWALLPHHTEEQSFSPTTLLQAMRRHDIRALRLFPDDHRYFLDEMTWTEEMALLTKHRIPLFVRASLDRIAALLRSFPDLIVITGSQGSNPLDRYAWPLIEKYPNLYFETSGYLVDNGIEEFCKRYSAARLIFGSGFPDNAAGAAMLTLAHAEISDADKRAIAWDNLSRLLAEARLE